MSGMMNAGHLFILPPRRELLMHALLPSFLTAPAVFKEGKISVAARQLILGWFNPFLLNIHV